MENQALWHERDISHSSAERIILPDATTLLHYALVSMRQIVEGMEVRRETMRRNLDAGLGLHAA
jgi:adenylosuccinate lyase